YGADDVVFEDRAPAQLRMLRRNGWDTLPVCVAKTQYSFSDDPAALGAPTGHLLHVRDLVPKIGAGFVVALTGAIMTMPGLPKEPAALRMGVTGHGEAVGLFCPAPRPGPGRSSGPRVALGDLLGLELGLVLEVDVDDVL